MEMKRIGIYCRVSTKEQTTDNQLLDLRKYCGARGWNIVAECVDNGISGAKDGGAAVPMLHRYSRCSSAVAPGRLTAQKTPF